MSFLDDPRLREERRYVFIVLPILVILSGVALFFLLQEKKYVAPKKAATPVVSVTPVATPPPIPSALIPADQPVEVFPPSTPLPAAPSSPPPAPAPIAPPEPAAAAQPPAQETLMTRAMIALREGRREEARRLLLEAVVANEDAAEASNVLGTMDYEEKDWDKALANFSAALDKNAQNPIYFLNRSEALRRLGRYEPAVADLEKGRVLAPNDPLYPNKILLARLESGDRDKVFKEVQAALAMNMSAYVANFLGAAAAIEMEAGNMPQGIGYLFDLRDRVAPLVFNIIVTDECFKPYSDRPEFIKLLPGQ